MTASTRPALDDATAGGPVAVDDDRDVAAADQQAIRVALVEDDLAFREEILRPQLVDAGFTVIGMGTALELYRVMLVAHPDVVLLDIGLPDENGFEVARHLRASSHVGIVMLTGRGDGVDHVRSLNVGADAFLPKPVDMKLLVATLRSLARRLQAARTAKLPLQRWRLDATGWGLLSPEGRGVALTASERTLLQVLVSADGHPVGRSALIAALAQGSADFDPHRLETLVHRLRRKVLAETGRTLPLRTIRGGGYLLSLDQRRG